MKCASPGDVVQSKLDALAAAQSRQASSGSEVLATMEKMLAQFAIMTGEGRAGECHLLVADQPLIDRSTDRLNDRRTDRRTD